MHVRSCLHTLFISVGDEGLGGGVQLVYAGHLLLAWDIIFNMKKNRALSVFSLFLDEGRSVCKCVCVCIRSHTHTLQVGYLHVSPGVGMRHLGSPKNPDGLNLGRHVFVYAYKVHMYICMLRIGMNSWTDCFFS